jgi:hypothetical protein
LTYQKVRALYPTKLAIFGFLQNQDMPDGPNGHIEGEWRKYNWSIGVWKDKNQITISSKLINE